jgi:CBS-domain-containing membrane protein
VRGERLVESSQRDLRFVRKLDVPVSTVMTSQDLITVRVGVSMEKAKELLHENRIEKLLVVDDRGNLRGLITIKDIEKQQLYPNATRTRSTAARGRGRGVTRTRSSAPRRCSARARTSCSSTARTDTPRRCCARSRSSTPRSPRSRSWAATSRPPRAPRR